MVLVHFSLTRRPFGVRDRSFGVRWRVESKVARVGGAILLWRRKPMYIKSRAKRMAGAGRTLEMWPIMVLSILGVTGSLDVGV